MSELLLLAKGKKNDNEFCKCICYGHMLLAPLVVQPPSHVLIFGFREVPDEIEDKVDGFVRLKLKKIVMELWQDVHNYKIYMSL